MRGVRDEPAWLLLTGTGCLRMQALHHRWSVRSLCYRQAQPVNVVMEGGIRSGMGQQRQQQVKHKPLEPTLKREAAARNRSSMYCGIHTLVAQRRNCVNLLTPRPHKAPPGERPHLQNSPHRICRTRNTHLREINQTFEQEAMRALCTARIGCARHGTYHAELRSMPLLEVHYF